jgi:hypothetical protein
VIARFYFCCIIAVVMLFMTSSVMGSTCTDQCIAGATSCMTQCNMSCANATTPCFMQAEWICHYCFQSPAQCAALCDAAMRSCEDQLNQCYGNCNVGCTGQLNQCLASCTPQLPVCNLSITPNTTVPWGGTYQFSLSTNMTFTNAYWWGTGINSNNVPSSMINNGATETYTNTYGPWNGTRYLKLYVNETEVCETNTLNINLAGQ